MNNGRACLLLRRLLRFLMTYHTAKRSLFTVQALSLGMVPISSYGALPVLLYIIVENSDIDLFQKPAGKHYANGVDIVNM